MAIQKIKNVDECKADFKSAFSAAMADGDEEKLAQAQEEFSEGLCRAMLKEYSAMSESDRTNKEVLAARGVRQLTTEETKYYTALANAMRADNGSIKNALEDVDVILPETIIDEVMNDVRTEFPLLDMIDFVNASYMTTWIYNKQGVQTASWGEIGSAITKELSGAFGKISTTQCKLTAYMVVSHDYLDLGPAWLDRYVRAILTEASGMAMESAIVDGAGNADGAPCPIGMTRDLDNGTVSGDVTTYPQKTPKDVTTLDPTTYGEILAELAKTPTDRDRRVGRLILVCNPQDYFLKVMPATTYMTPNGGYVNGVLPYPTEIIQSEGCPSGIAVVGIANQYVGLLGAGSKRGVITYDDSVQFLEDNRVYKTRLIANGKPKDNNSFIVLNIENLEPVTWTVKMNSSSGSDSGNDEP